MLISEPAFVISKGAEVEVSTEEEGFKGSLYRATIKEILTKLNPQVVLVEYATLLEEDGSTPLKEEVDAACIRPLPPEVEGNPKCFELSDIVDADCNDGWWMGIVKKVLEGARYRVYFYNQPDVLELDGKDLRLHLDWVDGKWVRPKKQQSSTSLFSCGETVEVIIEKDDVYDVWVPAIVITECGNDAFLVKRLFSRDGDDAEAIKVTVARHIRPPPSSLPCEEYNLRQPVDTVHELGLREGIITKILAGKRYVVHFKHGNEEKDFEHSNLRPHLEWVDGRWVDEQEERHADQRHINRIHGSEGNSQCAAKNESNETTPTRRNLRVCSTPCRDSSKLNPLKNRKEGNASKPPVSKKSSKSRKILDEGLSKEESSRGLAAPEPKSTRSKSSIRSENNDQSSGKRETLLTSEHPMKGTQRKRKRGIQVDTETSDQNTAEGNDSGCKITKVSKSAADAPISISEDDQPISTGTDGTRLSGAKETRDSSLGAVDCGNTDAAETSIDTQTESSSTIALALPFAKKSPMWKCIELMEVYRARPQQPHFALLLDSKKEHREGTALGMMITFANLLEKIGSLELDEPKDVLNSMMESLLGFEKDGFDIKSPLTQIQKLYNIKLWVENGLGISKEKEKEKDGLDSKSENYNKAMEEVRKKIGELAEVLASIKSKKEEVDNEIGRLKSNMEGISSDVQSHQLRFRDIVEAFRNGHDVC